MNVEQIIKALQGLIEGAPHLKHAGVTRDDYFDITDVYLDMDENGDPVVVID